MRMRTAGIAIGNKALFPLVVAVYAPSIRRSDRVRFLPMGFYGKRKSVSRVTSPDVVQKAFIVLWCLTVIWCEVGFFHLSLKDCQWPEKRLKASVRCPLFSSRSPDRLGLNHILSARANTFRIYSSSRTPRSRTPPSQRHGPSTACCSTYISRRAGTLRCISSLTT